MAKISKKGASNNKSQGTTIFIIYDSSTFCLIMARILQRFGCQVVTASNGKEGMEKALQEHPHCILLDVVLPGMSGLSLCRQLRGLDPQHTVAIILVST